MKPLNDFPTETYVRRPFQVQAFEITPDNIAELAPHVGELCDDKGTPYIKSDKKKVGNNFKVWSGFFATVLKGHVRCYSRKTFFEQFGELNDTTSPVVDFLHGRVTVEQMISTLQPDEVTGEPDQEEEALVADTEEPAVEEGPVNTCEHGTPEGQECVYKQCDGPEGTYEGDPTLVDPEDTVEESDEDSDDDEDKSEIEIGLQSVIKS